MEAGGLEPSLVQSQWMTLLPEEMSLPKAKLTLSWFHNHLFYMVSEDLTLEFTG